MKGIILSFEFPYKTNELCTGVFFNLRATTCFPNLRGEKDG
jgi:hypothetical protein